MQGNASQREGAGEGRRGGGGGEGDAWVAGEGDQYAQLITPPPSTPPPPSQNLKNCIWGLCHAGVTRGVLTSELGSRSASVVAGGNLQEVSNLLWCMGEGVKNNEEEDQEEMKR